MPASHQDSSTVAREIKIGQDQNFDPFFHVGMVIIPEVIKAKNVHAAIDYKDDTYDQGYTGALPSGSY